MVKYLSFKEKIKLMVVLTLNKKCTPMEEKKRKDERTGEMVR